MSKQQIRPFARRIDSIISLTDEEEEALDALPVTNEEFAKGQAILREGDRPTHCFFVISGATCIYKHTGAGSRQIVIFHFCGDVPDLQSLHLDVLDMGIEALSHCKLGFVEHEAVRKLYRRHPRIGDALWRNTLVDASILREWLLNVGQRSAFARLAHFLCECVVRLKLAGLEEDGAYPLPFTQTEIGDALGLSNIHINRIAQDMRDKGLIQLARGKLRIPSWPDLTAAGDFDLTYLHLTARQRALLEA